MDVLVSVTPAERLECGAPAMLHVMAGAMCVAGKPTINGASDYGHREIGAKPHPPDLPSLVGPGPKLG